MAIFILGINGDGQRLVAAKMGCRPNLLEQVEVPQAAVVTDYSDAIVIDQEVRMTGNRKHSWLCLKMGTYSPVGDS
jgi:hypothetical protein